MGHKSGWVQHETTIVLNTIHISLLTYYFLYELLVNLFSYMKYPRLPTLSFFKGVERTGTLEWRSWQSWRSWSWTDTLLKTSLWTGALIGAIGSANGNSFVLILSLMICTPFSAYSSYQMIIGRFYQVDVDNFLLFQALALTTVHFVEILTMIANFVLIVQLF